MAEADSTGAASSIGWQEAVAGLVPRGTGGDPEYFSGYLGGG